MPTLADLAASVGKSSTPQSSTRSLDPKVVKSLKGLQTTGKTITKAQPKLADLAKSIQAGTHEKAPGGPLSILNHVPGVNAVARLFSSQPVQTFFKVIDTPHAVVTSAAKEAQDIAYTHNNPQGGSLHDFVSQIFDTKKRITGAELAKQAITSAPVISHGLTQEKADELLKKPAVKIAQGITGFATDIATDPLMYVGVGEAGALAKGADTALERIATKGLSKPELAGKLFERGTELVKAGKTTDSELMGALERVASRGKAGLTDADRALYNVPKLELKFGTKGARVGIPGSEALLERGGKVTSALGEAVGGDKLSKVARTLLKSPEEADALAKIASGKGEEIVKGIGQRAEIYANRGVKNHVTDRLLRVAKESGLLKDAAESGPAVIHAVETGSLNGVAPKVRELFRNMFDVAAEHKVNLNDLGVDYIPHQVTAEGRKIVGQLGEAPNVLVKDTNRVVGPEQFRKLTAGYENEALFGKGPLQTGTVDEINGRFMAKHGVPLFKTDLPDVITSYAAAIGHAAGRTAGAKKLVEMGLAKPLGERLVDVRDTAPIQELAAKAADAQAAALKLHGDATKAIGGVADAGRREEAFQGALDALTNVKGSGVLPADMAESVAAKEGEALSALGGIQAEGLKARQAADKLAEKALTAKAVAEEHVGGLQDALAGTDAAATKRNTAIASAAAKSPHPQVAMTGKVEQWALDMEAKIGSNAPTFADIDTILKNAPARDVVVKGMEDGYKTLAKGYQAPEELVDALRVVQKVRDPQWWDGLMKRYDQFNNYFKAWAVASPGFLFRNLYSGIFNNFVHEVPFADHVAFREMFKVYKKDPLHYMETLTEKIGAADAKQFQDALVASAATGMGQARDEVLRNLTPPKHFGLNPLKADNWYTRTISKPNEEVEAWLRGAHALHSLREGKTLQDTIMSVTKYHFNYADLSDFDRKAKRVVPFWVFTARNVPLQLQIMATEPFRLNTINSFKQNMEALSAPEDIVPSYFGEQNNIRLPFKLPFGSGGTNYLVPDLPLMRLNETLTHFTDPVRVFSDANPAIKSVIERYANKQLFSDQPYTNRLKPAPNWAKIPGVEQALKQFGLVKDDIHGNPLMTDKTQVSLEGVLPILGRASRLAPELGGQEKYKQRAATSLLAYLGSSFATNTPAAQEGELYRRQKEMDQLVTQLKDQGFIKTKKKKVVA